MTEAWIDDPKPKTPQPVADFVPPKDDLPGWLRDAIANPPPPGDPTVAEEAERRSRVAEARLLRARLPAFVATPEPPALLERIPSPEFRRAAKEWTWGAGNLLLLGESDQGKTTAAAFLCRRLLAEGVSRGGHAWTMARGIRWYRAAKLVGAMKAWPFGKGDCPDLVDAVNATLLVLDDVGWEQDHAALGEVLAQRFDATDEDQSGPALVLTSGHTVKQLLEKFGDALTKRMVRNGTRPAIIARSFPKAEAAAAEKAAAEADERPRPPSDQEELARRQGEKW